MDKREIIKILKDKIKSIEENKSQDVRGVYILINDRNIELMDVHWYD